MKNMMLVSLVLVVLVGCVSNSPPEDQSKTQSVVVMTIPDTRVLDSGFIPGYTNWIKREWGQVEINNEGPVDLELAIRISTETFQDIEWKEKTGDKTYWKTSTETENDGYGNCIDISIDVFVKLRNLGFPDSNIGIVYMRKDDRAHACPCVFLNNNIYILDLSDRSEWKIIQAFNLEGCWKIQ